MSQAFSTAAEPRDISPVWRYLSAALKGVLSILCTLLGLAALTFFIGRLLPIDPVVAVIGDNASQEAYNQMYHQLGLDQPLWQQFADYLVSVAQDIARVFPATLELATVAAIIGTGLGIPSGVLSAMYRNSWFDHLIRFLGLISYSTPHFWLGLMGLLLFYASLGWIGGPRPCGFYL